MKCLCLVALAAVSACGRSDAPASKVAPGKGARAATTPPNPAPAKPKRAMPTPGTIAAIAVTEAGDAALTVDSVGALRLWPTLDGKQPPVPITGSAATQLALLRASGDLVAAIMDQAGDVELVRFDRAGAERSRVQLASDVEAEQIVAVGEAVLVRRRDQTIERYDARGALRGRIAAQAGEQIAQLAARRGAVVALLAPEAQISDAKSETGPGSGAASGDAGVPAGSSAMRWLLVGEPLAWGTKVKLETAIMPGTLAVSPSHRRIAGLAVATQAAVELDAQGKVIPTLGGPRLVQIATGSLGFATEDRVLVLGTGFATWWITSQRHDPWENTRTPGLPLDGNGVVGAVGDGIAVVNWGATLAIGDGTNVKYLGWTDIAMGGQSVGTHAITTTSNGHTLWLDGQLEVKRDIALAKLGVANATVMLPVGDHHAVVEAVGGCHDKKCTGSEVTLTLVDLDHSATRFEIGTFANFSQIGVEDGVNVLWFDVPGAGQTERWQLDLAHTTAKRLRGLRHNEYTTTQRVFDPARSGGLVAVMIDYTSGQRFITVRDGKRSKPSSYREDDALLAFDATGRIYTRAASGDTIIVKKAGKVVARIPFTGIAYNLTPSSDGSRLAVVVDQTLVMLDASGHELWRRPLWNGSVAFTGDDKQVIARSGGDLAMLDVATGAKAAAACGWNFGLHDEQPLAASQGLVMVCEDSIE